ncbi:MAG: hypothetical protein ACI9U2_003553 [Bradymonadia bacterium]|jgi:uncharacterized protein (DUF1501 family)
MNRMNRRELLVRAGLTAGAFTLGSGMMSRVAKAAVDNDHYFVFVYFEGGWDSLIGLDPRDPAIFTDADAVATGIQPGYDRLPGQYSRQQIDAGPFMLGPCIGELAPIADRFSVVRGINMATLTHEVGRRYFITGRPPAGLTARGNSVATLAAGQMMADRPVPHLSHLVESYNVDQPAYAAAMPVAAVDHIQYILQENLGLPTNVAPNVRGALGAYWQKARDCAPSRGAGASKLGDIYRDNRSRARDVMNSTLYRQFQFSSPETAAVRAHYGLGQGQLETPYGRAALAAQALKVGLSRVVSVTLANALDTHDQTWANDHSSRLEAGFSALARLITDLEQSEAPGGGSMLSKTTIIAYSEFQRTPRINERNGRDHHLGNCALVAGAGIKPGLVIGASSDNSMGPELINLQTGQPDEGGISLSPEHVLTTVLEAGGCDPASLRSAPIPALLA